MTAEQKKHYNGLRCIAHDIILELFKAKQKSQIRLLKQACDLSLKKL